jgi:hypothetical protein
MNEVICCGRLLGVEESERSAGNSCRSDGCSTWYTPLRTREVAQADGAQVLQRDGGRKPIGQQDGKRMGSQHLATVRRRHDPCRAVQHAAEEVVVAPLSDARVKAAANVQQDALRRSGIGEGILKRERGGNPIPGIVECGAHAVARHLDHAAVVRFDGGPRQRVVPGERRLHPPRLALPQLSAALDVGEQEGRDRGVIVHRVPWRQRKSGSYFTAEGRWPPAAGRPQAQGGGSRRAVAGPGLYPRFGSGA